jgi:hypothetical protein
VHLCPIGDDELAMGEAGERIELIDEELPEPPALLRIV